MTGSRRSTAGTSGAKRVVDACASLSLKVLGCSEGNRQHLTTFSRLISVYPRLTVVFSDAHYFSNVETAWFDGEEEMVAQAVAAVPGVPERAKTPSGEPHQVDAAGQAILSLVRKASTITEANNQRAAEMAEKLLHRLRAAEDRIASLQSEAQFYCEMSERAEDWLRRIYDEIEHQFIRQPQQKRVGE
jgi:hypothetical protein